MKEIKDKIKVINELICDLENNYNMAHIVLGADEEIASIANNPYADDEWENANGDYAVVTSYDGGLFLAKLSFNEGSDLSDWESWNYEKVK